jgi:hypothetical protein
VLVVQFAALGFLADSFRRFLKVKSIAQLVSILAILTHMVSYGLFFISSLIYIAMESKLMHEVLFGSPQIELVDRMFYAEWVTAYMAGFADLTFLYLLNVLTSRFLAFEKSSKLDDDFEGRISFTEEVNSVDLLEEDRSNMTIEQEERTNSVFVPPNREDSVKASTLGSFDQG